MPIITQKWITRSDLRNNPTSFYVFGDNVLRKGFGGQAKEMRGELNAIGVVTKWKPTMEPDAFFYDGDASAKDHILEDLNRVKRLSDLGHTVIIPEDGLGTGLSKLPITAPRLHRFIVHSLYRIRQGKDILN